MSINQDKLKAEKAAKARRSIKAVLAQTKASSEEPALTYVQNMLIELKARGFRQNEIAETLKTHQVIISFYANGKKTPSQEHLKALEHMLEEARQSHIAPVAASAVRSNADKEEYFAKRFEHLSRHLASMNGISPAVMFVSFMKQLGFNYYEIAAMLNMNLSTFNKSYKDDDFDTVAMAHMFDISTKCIEETDNSIIQYGARKIAESLERNIEVLTKQPTTI